MYTEEELLSNPLGKKLLQFGAILTPDLQPRLRPPGRFDSACVGSSPLLFSPMS